MTSVFSWEEKFPNQKKKKRERAIATSTVQKFLAKEEKKLQTFEMFRASD